MKPILIRSRLHVFLPERLISRVFGFSTKGNNRCGVIFAAEFLLLWEFFTKLHFCVPYELWAFVYIVLTMLNIDAVYSIMCLKWGENIAVFCKLKNWKMDVGECYDIQMVRNGYIKPDVLSSEIMLNEADLICPFCKWNQLSEGDKIADLLSYIKNELPFPSQINRYGFVSATQP